MFSPSQLIDSTFHLILDLFILRDYVLSFGNDELKKFVVFSKLRGYLSYSFFKISMGNFPSIF